METKYLSAAETAALIRVQLKNNFPGCKFYVNSKTYSGGASINVKWIDGPSKSQVEPILAAFNGADFDGMEDLKSYNTAWLLPDGSAKFETYAASARREIHYTQPHPEAVLVHFGADFIFAERSFTPAGIRSIAEPLREKYDLIPLSYYPASLWVNHKTQIEGLESVNLNGDNWTYWNERQWFRSELYKALDETERENKTAPAQELPEAKEQESIEISYDREWTWIKFPEKPSQEVRDMLTEKMRARWSGRRQAWYVCETVSETEIRIQLAAAAEVMA